MQRKWLLVLIVVLATAAAFVFSSGLQHALLLTTQTTSMAPTIVVVHMVSGSSRDPRLGFDPAEIRIILGLNNTVTWKNDDSDWHTAHSNIPEFDSKMIPPAGSYTHTFLTVGIYPYHCDPHPWMTGKITVTTAGSSTVSALSSSGTLNTDLVQPECWVVESNDSSIPEPALCVA